MKPPLAFDTSALVSLGHTELVELILEHYNVIISNRVLAELREIGEKDDNYARAARKWLDHSDKINIMNAVRSQVGEKEIFEIFSGIGPSGSRFAPLTPMGSTEPSEIYYFLQAHDSANIVKLQTSTYCQTFHH